MQLIARAPQREAAPPRGRHGSPSTPAQALRSGLGDAAPPLVAGENDHQSRSYTAVFTSICLAVRLAVWRYVLGGVERDRHGASRGLGWSAERGAGHGGGDPFGQKRCMRTRSASAETGLWRAVSSELAQRSATPGRRARRWHPRRHFRWRGGRLAAVSRASRASSRGAPHGRRVDVLETPAGNVRGTTSHKPGPTLTRVDPPRGARTATPDQPVSLQIGKKQVVLTERGGFEPPMDGYAHTGFRDRRIQPLCHLSGLRRTTR